MCEMYYIYYLFQPFLSGYDSNNMVSGKLKLGKDTLATLEGYWDGKITLTDKRTGVGGGDGGGGGGGSGGGGEQDKLTHQVRVEIIKINTKAAKRKD